MHRAMALDRPSTMDCWIFVVGMAWIVSTGSPFTGEEDCRDERLTQCVPNMSNVLDNRQLIFPTSEMELNSVCETLNAEIECIEKYIFMCFTEEEKDRYRRSRKDWMRIIDDLCTTGEFRNEYLNHAQCFNDSTSNYKQCIGIYHHLLQESTSVVRYCCAYSEFVSCTFQRVLLFCEPETVLFFRNFISRSTFLTFQGYCTNYTVGSEWCSSAVQLPASMLMICIALLLEIWVMFSGALATLPFSWTPA